MFPIRKTGLVLGLAIVGVLVAASGAIGYSGMFAPTTSKVTPRNALTIPPTVPISATVNWFTVIPTGGCTLLDANPISNFDADAVTNQAFRTIKDLQDASGTTLIFRLKYPASVGAGQSITLGIAGKGTNDAWDRLLRLSDSGRSIVITTKTNDITDGTWKYTDVDTRIHGCDGKGNRYFEVLVESVLGGTGANTATVECKMI